jgi:protein-S-isoprenylcysteine O-methyltransferase Ste14
MIIRLFVQMIAWIAFNAAILFLSAGTTRWPSAWCFLAILGGLGIAVGLWLARSDPALLRERMGSVVQPGQKAWDRVFMLALLAFFYAWLGFMAADAKRFQWSHVPVFVHGVGALLIVGSFLGGAATFRVNSFATPVVKLQRDRGQTIVTTGPYALVRHPMYASGVLFFLGVPLLLGSRWGLAAIPFLVLLLGIRALGEERMLRKEFPEYGDYAARVRSRFFPGIW